MLKVSGNSETIGGTTENLYLTETKIKTLAKQFETKTRTTTAPRSRITICYLINNKLNEKFMNKL